MYTQENLKSLFTTIFIYYYDANFDEKSKKVGAEWPNLFLLPNIKWHLSTVLRT